MVDYEYKEKYNAEYISKLLDKLNELNVKTIILTGISYRDGKAGVVVVDKGKREYYEHTKIDANFHGTGDIYSSVFVGSYLSGFSAYESAKKAADFIVSCIENTLKDKSHWYGVKFEPLLLNLLHEKSK